MTWTDERIDALKSLLAEGISALEVSQRMNRQFDADLTRNSILGKIHRLGLAARTHRRTPQANRMHARRAGSGQIRAIQRARAKASAPRLEPARVERMLPVPSAALNVRLIFRTPKQCSWVLGEPNGPDTVCCGATVTKRSWCAFHARAGWTS